ncbi:hypothetical protein CR513_23119, partial [Mucuna pruriens]
MTSHDAYCLLNEEGELSTFQEALRSSNVSLWMIAMQEKKMKAIHRNNKWVYKIKRDDNDQVERYRARLVLKGYAQKEGIDFNEIFSPVVRMTTIRIVLAMCAVFDLHLEQLDVKTAFLHGELEDKIYMLQLEGFKQQGKKNFVFKLSKSIYNLKKATRYWYKRFDSFIISLDYNILSSDHCTYYVDDMLVVGPNIDRIQELKAQLAKEFDMKDLGPANKILGMQIHRDRKDRKVWLSQKNYLLKILRRFNMQDCKPISTLLSMNYKLFSSMSPSSEEERMEMSRVPYASAVGSLMYAMICTRPDFAQAVGVVSKFMGNPGGEHSDVVKRIPIYINGTSTVALCYEGSEFIVRGYVDSDFAGDLDKRRSITSYMFTLVRGVVNWLSKLHTVVTLSMIEVEYMVAT